jgi:hypothetical protein
VCCLQTVMGFSGRDAAMRGKAMSGLAGRDTAWWGGVRQGMELLYPGEVG